MGEPQPGQIPDNIFLSVQQIKLEGSFSGLAGSFLTHATGEDYWHPAIEAEAKVGGIVQTRVDYDVLSGTVDTDSGVAIEAMAAPSYVYALNGTGTLAPGDLVTIDAATGKFELATATTAIGRYSRLAVDQAGNRSADTEDQVVIIKLGVN